MPEYGTILSTSELIKIFNSFPFVRKISHLQIHHTWKPTHYSFEKAKQTSNTPHLLLQNSMKTFHIKSNDYNDIAQHLTLFPDGKWGVGRNWNANPAGISNFNSGGFMIEMLGNFDDLSQEYNILGYDKLQNLQLKAIIEFTQAYLKKFPGETGIIFHRDKSTKTCPGTTINKANFIRLLSRYIFIPESQRLTISSIEEGLELANMGEKELNKPTPTIKQNLTKEEIIELQKKLIYLGYNLGSYGADGDYGKLTTQAVINFQTDFKISPIDGVAGPITIKALIQAYNNKLNSNSLYFIEEQIGTTKIFRTDLNNIKITSNNGYAKMTGLGISGTFSYKGQPGGIIVSDGQVLSINSAHGWQGKPDSCLCYYKDGTIGVERILTTHQLSKPVIWAISGLGIKVPYGYSPIKEGYTGIYADVLRDTGHTCIGIDENNKVILFYKTGNVERIKQSAENLKLKYCIMLDGGHVAAFNGNKYKVNISQPQQNWIGFKKTK